VLQNGPERRADRADATAGSVRASFAVDGTLGSGYGQQWNASCSAS
jgi:hypothetical protein